jgi:hypothetical protein
LGQPRILVIPEKYRRELPPLPSILDLRNPEYTFYRSDVKCYLTDPEGFRRISEPSYTKGPEL